MYSPNNSAVSKVLEGAQGKKAQGREVKVVAYPLHKLEYTINSAGCNILYVGECDSSCERLVLKAARKPILTISERKDVGIVRFVEISSRVRFSINKEDTDRAGLKISSHVLDLAVDVDNE